MMPDSERAFAEENGRAVLAMLDHQRLRPHGQHFLRGARQVAFRPASIFASVSLINSTSTSFSVSASSLRRAVDPVIHGVAARQPHAVHLPPHRGLQRRVDIRQEQKLRVLILPSESWAEFSNTLSVGEVGLRFVEVLGVLAAPAERLPGRTLDAARIDAALLQYLFVLRR